MHSAQRYPFVAADSELGEASLRPYLPLALTHQETSIEAIGLLDTGAMVNVLPYHLGVNLGAVWEAQTGSLELTVDILPRLKPMGIWWHQARVPATVLAVSAGLIPSTPQHRMPSVQMFTLALKSRSWMAPQLTQSQRLSYNSRSFF